MVILSDPLFLLLSEHVHVEQSEVVEAESESVEAVVGAELGC